MIGLAEEDTRLDRGKVEQISFTPEQAIFGELLPSRFWGCEKELPVAGSKSLARDGCLHRRRAIFAGMLQNLVAE